MMMMMILFLFHYAYAPPPTAFLPLRPHRLLLVFYLQLGCLARSSHSPPPTVTPSPCLCPDDDHPPLCQSNSTTNIHRGSVSVSLLTPPLPPLPLPLPLCLSPRPRRWMDGINGNVLVGSGIDNAVGEEGKTDRWMDGWCLLFVAEVGNEDGNEDARFLILCVG